MARSISKGPDVDANLNGKVAAMAEGRSSMNLAIRNAIELLIPADDSQRKSHPERTNQPSMQLGRTKKHGRMTWDCCWVWQQQDWKGSRTIGSSAIRTTEPNLGWAILQASLEHFPKARWRRSPATAKVARRKFKPMNFNEKKNKKNPGTDSQPWLRICSTKERIQNAEPAVDYADESKL